MDVAISHENEQFVEAAIERGQYANSSEIVDEALRLLRRRDELISAVNAGVEQLDRGETVDAEEVFERLTAKYSRNSGPSTD